MTVHTHGTTKDATYDTVGCWAIILSPFYLHVANNYILFTNCNRKHLNFSLIITAYVSSCITQTITLEVFVRRLRGFAWSHKLFGGNEVQGVYNLCLLHVPSSFLLGVLSSDRHMTNCVRASSIHCYISSSSMTAEYQPKCVHVCVYI